MDLDWLVPLLTAVAALLGALAKLAQVLRRAQRGEATWAEIVEEARTTGRPVERVLEETEKVVEQVDPAMAKRLRDGREKATKRLEGRRLTGATGEEKI